MASLVVDDRERLLIAALRKLKIPHKVQHLAVADILVLCGGSAVVALERKTCDDLAGSIVDGRLTEQKQRLIEMQRDEPQCAVGYLVEGDFFSCQRRHKLPPTTLLAASAMGVVRDRLALLRTRGTDETCALLKILLAKAPYGKTSMIKAPPRQSRAEKMSARDAVMQRILQCVPGCSPAVTAALTSMCPDMRALRERLTAPDGRRQIRETPRQGGKRKKIGEAVVRNLILALAVEERPSAPCGPAPKKRKRPQTGAT